ncbi:MAG: hypothetical protein WAK83_30555 [Trebonia sp.]
MSLPRSNSLCGRKFASITTAGASAASRHSSSIAAPPSRRDQARSGSGAPSASCSVSLSVSLVSSANLSSAASGPARLLFPAPGAPDT